jgi:uncharacterized protein YjdB
MKTRTCIAMPLMMGLALLPIGCGNSLSGPNDSVHVTPEAATLRAIGATVQFVATVNGGGFGGFVWDSSEEDVATVDSGGLATAVANGSTRICAHAVSLLSSVVCATLTVVIP